MKLTVWLVLALAPALAKKRRKKKPAAPAAPAALDECAACEHYAGDLAALVRAAVRKRLAPPRELPAGAVEPTWAMRLAKACRAPRTPFCERSWPARERALIAELEDLAADADAETDSSIAHLAVARAVCAVDGPLGACGARHRFKTRNERDAVDVAFLNRLADEVAVYWLKPDVDAATGTASVDANKLGGADAHVLRGAVAPRASLRENSFASHVYRAVVAGDWDGGVDVVVPGGGSAAAFAFEASNEGFKATPVPWPRDEF